MEGNISSSRNFQSPLNNDQHEELKTAAGGKMSPKDPQQQHNYDELST
jgi:hypothetical protein